MAIDSSKFRSNSLTGAVKVSGGYANISLPTAYYALEGNVSFNILVRTGSAEGPVIFTSPVVTLKDTSSFVSLTANTATLNEGDLVAFTLVTANALGNSTLYYSVFPATANVTSSDFVANTGSFYLTNNTGTFTLKANADLSLTNELGENFKVQLRTGSVTGNVVYTTSNITILDTSNVYNAILSPNYYTISEGSNVVFTFIPINIPIGTTLYYSTSGNATISSNTGSFTVGSSNTLTFSAPQVDDYTTQVFNVQIRSESVTGPVLFSSANVTINDSALSQMYAVGGNVVQYYKVATGESYRIHTFDTSNNLVITTAGSSPAYSTIEYQVVAGGASGGSGYWYTGSYGYPGGGGGAGGLAYGNVAVNSATISIIVGAGGAGVGPAPGLAGIPGSNSSISSPDIPGNITALGGGGGGAGGGGGYAGDGGSGGGAGAGAGSGGQAIPWTITGGTHYGTPGGSQAPNYYQGSGSAWAGGGGGAQPYPFKNASPTSSGGSAGMYTSISGTQVLYCVGGNAGYGVPGVPGGTIGGYGDLRGSGTDGGQGTPSPANRASVPGVPGRVILRYPYIPQPVYNSFTTTYLSLANGSNVEMVISTTYLKDGSNLYYTTVGNVISSDFVSGNTGSFRTSNNSTTLLIGTNRSIPLNETRTFQLQIRKSSITGTILHTSNVITISNTNPISAYYLAVAGGGGSLYPGGGGGGGAGGYIENAISINPGVQYNIVVGAGGSGAPGSNTTINNNLVCAVGGGSAQNSLYTSPADYNTPRNGGSGAGQSTPYPTYAGSLGSESRGLGYPGQGNPGGSSSGFYPGSYYNVISGAGGGGAGGAGGGGSAAQNSPYPAFLSSGAFGGDGGAGKSTTITGTSTFYAGGGGGWGVYTVNSPNPGYGGYGGSGGGGRGYSYNRNDGSSGGENLGGGAGGSAHSTTTGGSGIVVIAYANVYGNASVTTGNPNVIYANGNIIYRFWQSGSITL